MHSCHAGVVVADAYGLRVDRRHSLHVSSNADSRGMKIIVQGNYSKLVIGKHVSSRVL